MIVDAHDAGFVCIVDGKSDLVDKHAGDDCEYRDESDDGGDGKDDGDDGDGGDDFTLLRGRIASFEFLVAAEFNIAIEVSTGLMPELKNEFRSKSPHVFQRWFKVNAL
jgi:hypothetical protein